MIGLDLDPPCIRALALALAVWHGQRAGDAERASRGRGAAGEAGRVHAAVVDHQRGHGGGAGAGVRPRGAAAAPLPPPAGRRVARRGAVRAVGGAEAAGARPQHPAAHVLPGAEQDLGRGGHLRRGAGRARRPHLRRRRAARVRPAWRRRRRGRLPLARRRRAVRLHDDGGTIPRRVERVHRPCVQQPRRFRQAVAWVGRHDLVCLYFPSIPRLMSFFFSQHLFYFYLCTYEVQTFLHNAAHARHG